MRNPDRETTFRFKQFSVVNRLSAMKVGTDGVLLGAWAQPASSVSPRRILDVGCGTGLISLMMAQRFSDSEIVGIEIDPDSASEAEANFAASPWATRLQVIHGDYLQTAFEKTFDMIVSNPPFFTNGLLAPDSSRQQARHELSLPLASLITHSARCLSPSGTISLVLPSDRLADLQGTLPQSASHTTHLELSRLCRVSTVPSKPPRRLLAELRFRSEASTLLQDEQLFIQDSDSQFSPGYINLTKDFYLRF